MPSFLTKVFGRKKDDKDAAPHAANASRRTSAPPSLLDGKYEAVPTNVSPSATHFPDPHPPPAKESPLSLFRSRSRQPERPGNVAPAPVLTLNLPVPKEQKSTALGVVFEADPESAGLLSDAVVGGRRLSPLETLLLVKLCSSVIVDRGGLETLGLMHPHWHSSSPDAQRKLISQFILSLGSKSPITTLSPTPTSPSHIFEAELTYSRSLHDVASVLRWGIRHLQLEGPSFGNQDSTNSEWAWYSTFSTSERDKDFPTSAFSQALVPLLPPSHSQLLSAMLDIISSLAAHAEANGASGSKLAKLFGLWLLSVERARKDEDWTQFYKRWERAGRIFEHLFLAHVREESIANRMPLRLSELVKHYPYRSARDENPTDELPLLPIPRFSTRRYDALFVRIDSVLPTPTSSRPAKEHPLLLITEALKVVAGADAKIAEDVGAIWEEIKAKAAESDSPDSENSSLSISNILADETVRLLTLVPAGPGSVPTSPTFKLHSAPPTLRPVQPIQRRRSSSSPVDGPKVGSNGAVTSTSPSLTNWADFSMIGFGESNLDNNLASTLSQSEVEITQPPPTPPQPKKRKVSPPRGRRSSVDNPAPRPAIKEEPKLPTTLAQVSMIQIDEAFFDFWSDTLLDPIAADWPSFIVCQLKPLSSKVGLLVIEHSYTRPAPAALPPSPNPIHEATKRASSPRPSVSASIGGRKSFSFSPTIKRFSFFSQSHSPAGEQTATKSGKKAGGKASVKSPRIGELGEILPEEDEKPASPPAPESNGEKPVQGLGIIAEVPKESKPQAELPPVPVVEAALPSVPEDAVAPVATEPLRTESDAPQKPAVASTPDLPVPQDETALDETKVETAAETVLPPAPETVVLTGATPGPEVALASSELVALAQASEAVAEPEAAVEQTPAEPEVVPEVPAKTEALVEAPTTEPVPIAEAVPEPIVEAVPEPIVEATPEPAAGAAPKPEVSPVVELEASPAAEPETVPAAEEAKEAPVVEDVPVAVQSTEETSAEPVEQIEELVPEKPVEVAPVVEEPIKEEPIEAVPVVEQPAKEEVVEAATVREDKKGPEPVIDVPPVVAVADAPVEVPEVSSEPVAQEAPAPAEPVALVEEAPAPIEPVAPADEPSAPAEPVAPAEPEAAAEPVAEDIPATAEPAPAPIVEENDEPRVATPEPEAQEPVVEAAPAKPEEPAVAVVEPDEPAAETPTPALVEEAEETEATEESEEAAAVATPTEAQTSEPKAKEGGSKKKRNRKQKR